MQILIFTISLLCLLAEAEPLTLTKDDFFENIERGGRFFAPWCGVCKRMEPEWNLASESAPDGVAYANIDGESVKKLQKQIGISGYPSLVFFKDGNLLFEYRGERTKEAFNKAARKIMEPFFLRASLSSNNLKRAIFTFQTSKKSKERSETNFFLLGHFNNEKFQQSSIFSHFSSAAKQYLPYPSRFYTVNMPYIDYDTIKANQQTNHKKKLINNINENQQEKEALNDNQNDIINEQNEQELINTEEKELTKQERVLDTFISIIKEAKLCPNIEQDSELPKFVSFQTYDKLKKIIQPILENDIKSEDIYNLLTQYLNKSDLKKFIDLLNDEDFYLLIASEINGKIIEAFPIISDNFYSTNYADQQPNISHYSTKQPSNRKISEKSQEKQTIRQKTSISQDSASLQLPKSKLSEILKNPSNPLNARWPVSPNALIPHTFLGQWIFDRIYGPGSWFSAELHDYIDVLNRNAVFGVVSKEGMKNKQKLGVDDNNGNNEQIGQQGGNIDDNEEEDVDYLKMAKDFRDFAQQYTCETSKPVIQSQIQSEQQQDQNQLTGINNEQQEDIENQADNDNDSIKQEQQQINQQQTQSKSNKQSKFSNVQSKPNPQTLNQAPTPIFFFSLIDADKYKTFYDHFNTDRETPPLIFAYNSTSEETWTEQIMFNLTERKEYESEQIRLKMRSEKKKRYQEIQEKTSDQAEFDLQIASLNDEEDKIYETRLKQLKLNTFSNKLMHQFLNKVINRETPSTIYKHPFSDKMEDFFNEHLVKIIVVIVAFFAIIIGSLIYCICKSDICSDQEKFQDKMEMMAERQRQQQIQDKMEKQGIYVNPQITQAAGRKFHASKKEQAQAAQIAAMRKKQNNKNKTSNDEQESDEITDEKQQRIRQLHQFQEVLKKQGEDIDAKLPTFEQMDEDEQEKFREQVNIWNQNKEYVNQFRNEVYLENQAFLQKQGAFAQQQQMKQQKEEKKKKKTQKDQQEKEQLNLQKQQKKQLKKEEQQKLLMQQKIQQLQEQQLELKAKKGTKLKKK